MTSVPISQESLENWLGRQESTSDRIGAAPAAGLLATLDRDTGRVREGDLLEPLFHWLYFQPVSTMSSLGVDGHPKRGGFLPPVPLPRRMWAGGRLHFLEPLRIGDRVTRESEITSIRSKEGRSGRLVFVTVEHVCKRADGKIAIVEEQDLVYRDLASSVAGAPPQPVAPIDAVWLRELDVDPVLLFRYSALTFNSHRIHYDRGYATTVEGYPGLVVQAPLLATLLLDLVSREMPDARISGFEFRAIRPLFEGTALQLCGTPDVPARRVSLWAAARDGAPCMNALATLA